MTERIKYGDSNDQSPNGDGATALAEREGLGQENSQIWTPKPAELWVPKNDISVASVEEVELLGNNLTPGDVVGRYNNMKTELDKVLVGEDVAKHAVLLGLFRGVPVMLAGWPGGSKSNLSEAVSYLVEGTHDNENLIGLVSAQHDLMGNQLVGGGIDTEKHGEINEEAIDEYMKTQVKGIINGDIWFLRLEELNRMNPYAVNSLLPILAYSRIENASGEEEMNQLLLIVATQNASDSQQSNFELSDAAASRMQIGAVAGYEGQNDEMEEDPLDLTAEYSVKDLNEDEQRLHDVKKLHRERANEVEGRRWRPKDIIKPHIRPREILAVDKYLAQITLSERDDVLATKIGDRVTKVLRNEGIVREANNRFGLQIADNTRSFAGLRRTNKAPQVEDFRDSARIAIASRVGSLANAKQVEELLEKVAA